MPVSHYPDQQLSMPNNTPSDTVTDRLAPGQKQSPSDQSVDPVPPDWLREALITAIHDVRDETGKHLGPREINDGYCRLFARAVLDRVDQDAITVLSDGRDHTFIAYCSTYYDAERIQYGARSLDHLPFYAHPETETPDRADLLEGFPDSPDSETPRK